MFKKHITRNGESMLVVEMNDSHLFNTIQLMCNQIKDIRASVDPGDSTMSTLDQELYQVKPIDAAEAARRIKDKAEALYPYLAEAWLRPAIIQGVQVVVQDAFGRIGGIKRATRLVLSSGNSEFDPEWAGDN